MGDIFENTDATERIRYYFSSTIVFPTAVFNGTSEVIGAQPGTINEYLSVYYDQMLNASPCALNILVEYDSTSRFLKVKSRVTAVDTFSNAHLRYAIAESHIHHHWGSQYTLWLDSLHHVVRKMLPDYDGVTFSIDPGETFLDSQTFVLPESWEDKNCFVMVFVQEDDTGEFNQPVLRSVKSGLFQTLTWVFGDASGDGMVNTEDVVYLINYLFLDGPGPSPRASGDPNDDCIINVSDVVYLINYLFVAGPAPLEGCAE